MDPLVVPIVAGATGALVKDVTSKGMDWLLALVAAHSPAVQRQALANTQRFVERLAIRVETLEAELPTGEERQRIAEALDHPSTAFLIQRAVVSAATTDNDDRHLILSELITKRLTAGADDLVALAGQAACDVVISLSSLQVRFLAVAAVTRAIRPRGPISIQSNEDYERRRRDWWDEMLSPVCESQLLSIRGIDLDHLAALACVRFQPFAPTINATFALKTDPPVTEQQPPRLDAFGWWPVFDHLWQTGLSVCQPTTTGLLIGTLHHDAVSKVRTTIGWDDRNRGPLAAGTPKTPS